METNSKRYVGIIVLSIAMITLTAAILFNRWNDDPNNQMKSYEFRDRTLMLAALIIMYVSLILVFISYKGDEENYLSGLYAAIIVINLLIALGYDISYGVILLLMIGLLTVLIIITRVTKGYYLFISIIILIVALVSQAGIYV
jgi:hypothetical protein